MSKLPDAMQFIYADLVMRAAGLKPEVPYPGYNVPWPCRCTQCGGRVTPRFRQIRDGIGGCRSCAMRARHAQRRAQNQPNPGGRPSRQRSA
ncbi:hypothetical protein [Streptomyces sp. NPDC006335]|uniref:hypothetical protein n=1 Tax=Streptomyces sp. NPDC006335 TaxID=3156895 RepID=UPI0033A3FC6E